MHALALKHILALCNVQRGQNCFCGVLHAQKHIIKETTSRSSIESVIRGQWIPT
uniref:Uncharacterized protein n=1 Tax=Arundo donax TaxID=35708 RepID=A0A0A8Y021_ARUDO